MTYISLGNKPNLRIVRELPESASIGPGLYQVSTEFIAQAELQDSKIAAERLVRMVGDLQYQIRKQDMRAAIGWNLIWADLEITEETSPAGKTLIGKSNIVFEIKDVGQFGYAASPFIVLKWIIAGILAAITAWLAIKVITHTVYVVEYIGEGMRESAQTVGQLMPYILPGLAIGLLIALIYRYA
ncbi:MAG: hypothetical protein QXT26_07340 [Thermoproteota archaeon]